MTDAELDSLSLTRPDDSEDSRPLSPSPVRGEGRGEGDAEGLPEGWVVAPLGEVCLLNPPKPPADG
jgi:hypothetical protein